MKWFVFGKVILCLQEEQDDLIKQGDEYCRQQIGYLDIVLFQHVQTDADDQQTTKTGHIGFGCFGQQGLQVGGGQREAALI